MGRFERPEPTDRSGAKSRAAGARRARRRASAGRVAQSLVAAVDERGVLGRMVADERGSDAGEQHLAAGPMASNRATRLKRPEVVAIAGLGAAAVDGHPGRNAAPSGHSCRSTPLAVECGRDRRFRIVEAASARRRSS